MGFRVTNYGTCVRDEENNIVFDDSMKIFDDKMREEYANLIAAAPDMYESAKACIETWNHEDYSENSFEACMHLLEAALAKADGK